MIDSSGKQNVNEESHSSEVSRIQTGLEKLQDQFVSKDFLKLCGWIQEAHNDELNDTLSTRHPEDIEIKGSFHPADAYNMIYVLKLKKQFVTLRLSEAKFIQESFTISMNGLSSLPIKIKKLMIYGNKIGNEGARKIVTRHHIVQLLMLWNCNITGEGAKAIADALASLSIPVSQLELSLDYNENRNEGAIEIAKSVDMIQSLKLRLCGIIKAAAIGDVLTSLSVPMKELLLGNNKIGNGDVKKIANGIHNVQELNLWECGIT